MRLRARLGMRIDAEQFMRVWKPEQQGPPVQFTFDEQGLSATSNGWDAAILKQTIQIAVHRLTPSCSIQWE
jgi:hypothetical protein